MLASKNPKPGKRGLAQSGGRNEKPRQHWCVAGYPLLLTASFASILGGEGVRFAYVCISPHKYIFLVMRQ